MNGEWIIARYALVEIENLHDPVMAFEPIHRGLFEVKEPLVKKINSVFENQIIIEKSHHPKRSSKKLTQPLPGNNPLALLKIKNITKLIF